ncbi:MAG: ECF transporter S component [Clostridiales bacterium]|jgi:energy-coupling factor transport system substrate-specific component|nr:ECF transporter S component [Clostridiales bacterium]
MGKNKKSFIQGIKDQFSVKAIVLIPIAVGINLVGGMLASNLKLPIFLDMIGTIVSAALAGPWVAALVGLLTNIFLALVSNPVYLPYSVVSVGVALVVGFMMRAGLFKKIWGVVIIWLASTVVSAALAGSVTYFVFGGATGATGSSLLTVTLIAATQEILGSIFASSMIENLIDRAIAFAIAYVILKYIPKRLRSQYSLDGTDDFAEDPDGSPA